MKRYRVLSFDFDSRVHALTREIKDEWDESVKAAHEHNKYLTQQGLLFEFGIQDFRQKEQDFVAIEAKPLSVLAFHNLFQEQVRRAFIIGSYYPALVAACALGERILNHLIIRFRDYFKSSHFYKKVYRKNSFDSWELAISALEEWEILTPEVSETFRQLHQLRNQSLHFNPETDTNARDLALKAIKLLSEIIAKRFSSFVGQQWTIDMPGEIFLKRKAESNPFIKEIYIPNAHLVGPYHELEFKNNHIIVHDDFDYDDREITDDEFIALRRKGFAERARKRQA